MKAFEMIIEDREDVYKLTRSAESKERLIEMYEGNGEFVRIKDVTRETPIALAKLIDNLEIVGYDKKEIEIIVSLVSMYEGSY